ncbi:MAG: glycoside hydrolase family 97 protein [Terriglobia bacterium]|jgi:alpha-glucosidase
MERTFSRLLFATTCFILILVSTPGARAADALSVTSPDGNLVISFALKSNPQPYLPGMRAYYRITYRGVAVLTDSPLGLDFDGASPLDHDFEIIDTDQHSHADAWTNPFGAQRNIPDHYNQLRVSLQEKQPPGRRVDLIFRAYNEGAAFRYFLPQQPALEKFTLLAENTGFYFAREVSAFALNLGRFNTSNEGEYGPTKLNLIKPSSIINLPLLVKIPGGPWVGLLEADLTDYAGMYVGGVPGFENALVSRLSPSRDRMDQAVLGSTPKTSPWRVLLINDRPGGLIESNYLILNLSAPSALADTSWIEPGKAAWDWWSGSFARNVSFQPGMNTATMEHYVDFAAEHHLEYMLVDAGWYPAKDYTHPDDILSYVPEVNVPEIIAHAKQKGVKVLLWVYWGAMDKQMDEALDLYAKWGAAGIKVDFMDHDDQQMVNFYERLVRKAAEHHLVVDLHGAYKPTGLRRTYPNLLTREGVMGMEYSKWSDRVTPEHDVTIPFTRMLAGPMDYTPGCFNNATREQFKPRNLEPMCQGTRAHQLAMYVVFESPLVMLSDYPEDYDHNPGMEFLDKVPTVWDETKVLNGEPARYVTIARRHGDTWYLGAMTNWDARDLEIPLGLLGAGEYEAQIFADGTDADKVATSLAISRKKMKMADKLTLHLAPGGGAAVIFTPAR